MSLKAREVLIMGQMPSFEERAVQMEAVLKQSVTTSYYGEQGYDHRNPHPEVLKELTDSRHSVFDVLPIFFDHDDPWIALAALEVYVRRAYKAYTLLSVDYVEGDGLDDGDDPHAVTWRFKLGQSYAAPTTPTL